MSELKQIPIDQIDKGDRARKDYKHIKELWLSIVENGLINPISVILKETILEPEKFEGEEWDQDKPYYLLAGGRRLAAFEYGERKEAECKILDAEKDIIEVKKIELYENIDRDDLEWREEVSLKRQIHDLENEIAEKAGTKQSLRETAGQLGVSYGNLSEDIKLAEALEAIPTLGRHKTKSDAKKELNQMFRALDDKKAVEQITREREKDGREGTHKKIAGRYKTCSCIEGMGSFESGTVDLVELDPPLEIGFEGVDRYDHTSYNDVKKDDYLAFMRKHLKEAYRILKNHSWIVVWYPIEPWHQPLLEIMQETGFKVRGIPLVWDKGQGQTRAANTNMGNAYEVAFYGRKGEAILEQPGRKNVFSFKPVDKSKRFHPTEKPIELYADILQTFCRKGKTCITGFAGSGNMILAAENLGLVSFGFDTSTDWKNKFDLKVYDNVPPNYSSYR